VTVRSRLALTVVCFLLGASLVAQMRGRRGQALPSVPGKDLSTILGGLVVANADLRTEVQKLDGELRAYDQAAERAVLPQMVEELARMRILNGHIEVAGPGVEVSIGAGVSAIDLQDTLNEIRNTGAEAISLNDTRLAPFSAITEDDQDIILEGLRLRPPYVFQVIGDPSTMETALNRPGGQLDILRMYYTGLQLEVKSTQLMVLHARSQDRGFLVAQPVEQPG
jgi:uncharacterized protein YlxW (UPF0749 family)